MQPRLAASSGRRRAGLLRARGRSRRQKSAIAFKRRLRRLAVRDVLDARDQQHFDRAGALLPRDLDLAFGAVVIVLALDDQDRHADVGEPVADVPALEIVLHPDVGPAAHRGVGVGVPALEPLPHVGGVEGVPDLPDRIDRHILDDEMRRHQHQPAHAMVLHAAAVDRGDRGAVAVADQQSLTEADRVEQARQNLLRLDMHEIERAGQLARDSIGRSRRATRRTRRSRSRPTAFRGNRPTCRRSPAPRAAASRSALDAGAVRPCGIPAASRRIRESPGPRVSPLRVYIDPPRQKCPAPKCPRPMAWAAKCPDTDAGPAAPPPAPPRCRTTPPCPARSDNAGRRCG